MPRGSEERARDAGRAYERGSGDGREASEMEYAINHDARAVVLSGRAARAARAACARGVCGVFWA